MRLVSYDFQGMIRVGVQSNEMIIDLASAGSELTRTLGLNSESVNAMSDMLSLLEGGTRAMDTAARLAGESLKAIERGADETLREAGVVLPLNAVRLKAPIPRPRKNVMCLGLNYHDHWAETMGRRGEPLPSIPIFFTKSPTTVIGPFDDIVYPAATKELDYEIELAVIVGRKGKDIPGNKVFDYVAGYTILDDVSARDLQRKHQQWFRSKSLDTFAPMGPCLVTKDEIEDPHNLDLELKVNGETRQKSNTKNLIFKIPDIIEVLSQDMTLEPGDIIATGTPAGVGLGMSPPKYLKPGDVVEARIEGLGLIRNKVAEKRTRL